MSSLGSSFWTGFVPLRKWRLFLSRHHNISHCSRWVLSRGFLFLSFLFTSVSESLAPSLLSDGLWFALLNTLPSPPLPSPVNKQPEPAPRRTSVLNRKQSPLTSPTFQPPLPPLEAGTPTQLEPHPPPPPSEAEQPGLSVAGSGGGGGGLVGGVQVATVQHQVVTQLSTEESR